VDAILIACALDERRIRVNPIRFGAFFFRCLGQCRDATPSEAGRGGPSAVAELKTRQTDASVEAYLDAIDDVQRREDCRALAALIRRVTKCEPKMWGASIVGFGSYHYKYESGHEGDACLAGFSSRKAEISLYLMPGLDATQTLLAALGKHKAGKGCLYVKRLSDIDVRVLENLIRDTVAELRRRYPK
jgi:hypothetical protein